MYRLRFVGFFLLLLALVGGCQKNDPLSDLQEQAAKLQNALENKDISAVKALLHSDFRLANGQDALWAERSMRLAFLRHKNIRILTLRQAHKLDSSYHDRAHSSADIAISGAEGLLPERAGHYRVELQWQQENGEWRLADLRWE